VKFFNPLRRRGYASPPATTEISTRATAAGPGTRTRRVRADQPDCGGGAGDDATIGEISPQRGVGRAASRTSAETADQGGAYAGPTTTMEKIASASSSVSDKDDVAGLAL